MDQTKVALMRSILTKWVNQVELSKAEQQQLDEWLAENQFNRDLFRDISDKKTLAAQLEEYAEMHHGFKKRLPSIINLPVFKYAAAAAAVLLIAGGAYFSFIKKPSIDRAATVQTTPVAPAVILPGSNKAILTLADNTQVVLDGQSGKIAQQGTANINAANGELVYENASTSSKPGTPVAGFNTVSTPRGGSSYRIALSDGSVVYLNSESSLKYPPVFSSNERMVELTGEAYFEVARRLIPGTGERVPFIVKTATQSVEVHGTKFDINDYRDQEGSTVSTLLEGAVSIDAGNEQQRLRPGQRAVLDNRSSHLVVENAAAPDDAILWLNGAFAFHNATLVQTMKEISRWYDVTYEFDKNIQQDKLVKAGISGTIERNIPLGDLLKNLTPVIGNNLRLSVKGKTIYIESADSHEK
jgi:transmembrane sensor